MQTNELVSLFKPEELDVLTSVFRLRIDPSPERTFSIPSSDLLDKDKCLAYMEGITGIFESSSMVAVISQFSKRYAYMTMASGLYAMTMFDKGLDYSVDNCHIESVYHGESWLPEVRLTDWQETSPEDGKRSEWRQQVIRNIFADNIAKVWCSIAKAANVPVAMLWENMAISLYWLYEKRMGEGADERQKARIHEDYHYLLHEAPAELFGETENPLAKFNSPKCATPASDVAIRMRKTCCFLYEIPGEAVYCITCPKMKYSS
ncbi:IucA/IucC family C-terminal-domain containing protein [Paenibacillus tarimensis]